MNILFVTNIPTPYRQHFYNSLASEIASRGGKLRVTFCRKTEPNREWIVDLAKAQFDHRILPGYMLTLPDAYVHTNFEIIGEILKFRPDVVIFAGSWLFPTMWLGRLICRRLRIPTVFWSEGHPDATRRKSWLVSALRTWIIRGFDAFACPNELSYTWAVRTANDLRRREYIRLPNTIDEKIFSSVQPSSLMKRNEFGLAGTSIVFVTVCRLESSKGVIELSKCIVELREAGKDCALIVVGNGTLASDISRIAKSSDSIIYLGNRTQAEVREIFSVSDCFVLNTQLDKNPLSPIEAAMSGLPVLITSFAGNAFDLIEDGQTGYIIKQREDLPLMLGKLIDLGRDSLKQMGVKSLARASAKFDVEQVCRTFTDDLWQFAANR